VVEYRVTAPGGITGGITFPVYQDNRKPTAVGDLTAEAAIDSTDGGEMERPFRVRLSWTPVVHDVGGTAEMINYYEVHRDLTDAFVPGERTLIGLASTDEDVTRPLFQYVDHDPALDPHVHYYYRIVPIDLVDWRGDPSNTANVFALPLRDFADLDVGNVKTTVTERGAIGFLDGTQTQGSGFVFPKSGANQLYIGGLWVGRSAAAVANRDYDADPLREWEVAEQPDGHLLDLSGPADQGYVAGIADSAVSGGSMGLYVRQESMAWSEGGASRYVIFRYVIENRSAQALSSLYAGVFCDWDIGTQYLHNTGRVETTRNLVYLGSESENLWCGIRLLQGPGTPPRANLSLIDNVTFVWPNSYVLDADKYAFLAGLDPAHVMTESPSGADYGTIASAGPFALSAGGTQEFVVALVAGSSLDALREASDHAAAHYPFEPSSTPDAQSGESRATGLTFCRPSPFSAGTTIGFAMAVSGNVRLEVFDVTGRSVRTLLDGIEGAGTHQIVWDGRDSAGRRAGSGVYFIKLVARTTRDSRAVILAR
jgi:hypothetical protein